MCNRFAEKKAEGRKKKINTPAGKSVGIADFGDQANNDSESDPDADLEVNDDGSLQSTSDSGSSDESDASTDVSSHGTDVSTAGVDGAAGDNNSSGEDDDPSAETEDNALTGMHPHL
jgi:hypothetical protein